MISSVVGLKILKTLGLKFLPEEVLSLFNLPEIYSLFNLDENENIIFSMIDEILSEKSIFLEPSKKDLLFSATSLFKAKTLPIAIGVIATAGILKIILDKTEQKEEIKAINNLEEKINNVLSVWLFEIYKDDGLTELYCDEIINSIQEFSPEKINNYGENKYFKDTFVAIELIFQKEGSEIGTYLKGYLMNKEGKFLKKEIKLFKYRDQVPNYARGALLRSEEDNLILELYNNSQSFSRSNK